MTNELPMSEQTARVFLVLLENGDKWVTSANLSLVAGVNGRTARATLLKMAQAGIVLRVSTFPGFRYKLDVNAEKNNPDLIKQLTNLAEVLTA